MATTTQKKTRGRMDIRKGDTVLVLAGKDKNQRGRVIQAIPDEGKVVVEGINIVTRHQKPRAGSSQRIAQQQTGLIKKPAPLPRSKVMLICPQCSKPTRIKHDKGGRTCNECGELITEA